MGKYIINQESVDKIHAHFRKAILKSASVEERTVENIYINPDQVKKIKAEISRLKIILRECRPDQAEFYQEIIDLLQSKIKS